VAVVLVLAALWLAGRLYGRFADPYQPRVTGIEQVTEESVTVLFTVHRPDSRSATCRIQAKDAAGAEVGYAEVPVGAQIPAGADGPVSAKLLTTRRAAVADVLGCRPA
jgi:hypothetical protein